MTLFFHRRQVNRALETIRREQLHGYHIAPPPGFKRGVDVLGRQLDKAVFLSAQSYRRRHRQLPNLITPTGFTEKQVLFKFFGPVPVAPSPSDKLMTTHYVPESHRHLVSIPRRFGITPDPEVPADSSVPAGDYYLKSNHGCGTNMPVSYPLSATRRRRLNRKVRHWMKHIHSPRRSLWWYEAIDRRLFLEEDISDITGTAADWKFFVFHGKVEIFQVDENRASDHVQTLYERNGEFINQALYCPMGKPREMPPQLDTMIDVAEAIGRQFEFIRVDLYLKDATIYLGEITLVPTGGVRQIRTPALDARLGSAWTPSWMGPSPRDVHDIITGDEEPSAHHPTAH